MTDRDALIAAIVADPGDSTARGALADLLDEQGEHDKAAAMRGPGVWRINRVYARAGGWQLCWWSDFSAVPVGDVPEPDPCFELGCVGRWNRVCAVEGRWVCAWCSLQSSLARERLG